MLQDRIIRDPEIMFGKPVIKGTRVPVETILRKLAAGMSEQEIVRHHGHLTSEDIRAAAAFAADYLSSEGVVDAARSSP